MANQPLMQVTGFETLVEKIKALSSDRQKYTEMMKVLRKSAQGTLRVARTQVPVSRKPHLVSGSRTRKMIQPGALKKSLGVISAKKAKTGGNPVVYVGPRAKGNFDGWYGHFVEYGHNVYRKGFKRKRSATEKARRHNSAGATKRTQGNPFMERTYNATKGQVTEETVSSVAKYIQKRIDALSR